MEIQELIDYVVANKEIILIVLICGSLLTTLIQGAKRIISAVFTVMVLFAALSFFGVPMDQVQQGFDNGVSRFEEMFGWAKDNLPGYLEKAEDLTNMAAQATASAGEKSDGNVSQSDFDGDVLVHFLDVGQADCIFIQDGSDAVLIDTGNRNDDALVIDYLDGLGIEQIDYFIATHPHEDHIGCAGEIIQNFNVETIIKSEADNTTACYRNMMEAVEETGVEVCIPTPGDTFTLENGKFQILGPITVDDETDLNNTSIVIRYKYGDVSFLFAGDAEREEELEILDSGYDVESTVLKVGHHGSSTSTTYPWLRAVMPEYAVIMCGEGNEYGHPHEETMSKLRDAEVTECFRTDLNGTIVMETDGSAIEVNTEK